MFPQRFLAQRQRRVRWLGIFAAPAAAASTGDNRQRPFSREVSGSSPRCAALVPDTAAVRAAAPRARDAPPTPPSAAGGWPGGLGSGWPKAARSTGSPAAGLASGIAASPLPGVVSAAAAATPGRPLSSVAKSARVTYHRRPWRWLFRQRALSGRASWQAFTRWQWSSMILCGGGCPNVRKQRARASCTHPLHCPPRPRAAYSSCIFCSCRSSSRASLGAMALGERIEGFQAETRCRCQSAWPVAVWASCTWTACSCCRMASSRRLRKSWVAPFGLSQSVRGSLPKACAVFVAILQQQGEFLPGVVFAGQQRSEALRRQIVAIAHQVEQGLQREGLDHEGSGDWVGAGDGILAACRTFTGPQAAEARISRGSGKRVLQGAAQRRRQTRLSPGAAALNPRDHPSAIPLDERGRATHPGTAVNLLDVVTHRVR